MEFSLFCISIFLPHTHDGGYKFTCYFYEPGLQLLFLFREIFTERRASLFFAKVFNTFLFEPQTSKNMSVPLHLLVLICLRKKIVWYAKVSCFIFLNTILFLIGAGKAIHYIARSLMKLGRKDEALMQLTKHANEAKHQGILISYSEACSTLAELYNNKGDFVKASEYSQESFKTLRDIGQTNSATFDSIMAQFGVCQGHKFGGQLLLLMEQQSQESVAQVISWKNSRSLPTSSAPSRNQTSLDGDPEQQMDDATPAEAPVDAKMEVDNSGNDSHEHLTDESMTPGNSSYSLS